jgi:hypothetical protein
MGQENINTLKGFFKSPDANATAKETQIKIGKSQYDSVVESSLNLTDGGTVTGPFTIGNIQSAVGLDEAHYIINGSRGEVRSQLQGSVAADTGFTVELRNTSITTTSLIVANVIGGEGAIVTGSVVTANVIAASSASLNFFNSGDNPIANDSIFTASFAIL